MAEETKEGTVAEPTAEPKNEKDLDGLIAELEKAQVTKVEDLQGKLRASKEAGQLANILGQVRSENQELKEMIKALKTSSKSEEFDYSTGQPVDIEEVVARSVEKVLTKKEKAQAENQAKFLETWNGIQGDEEYHLVKEIWEEKLKDPNFVFQIQSGQVDPNRAYNKTVRDFYKGMLKRSAETMKSLKTAGIKPPHMESEGAVEKSQPQTPEGKEKLKRLQEKVNKGYVPTDEEVMSLMFQ